MQPPVPTIMPTLRRKKDFRPQANHASEFWAIHTTTPPLDDAQVRYALNMGKAKIVGDPPDPATAAANFSHGGPLVRPTQ